MEAEDIAYSAERVIYLHQLFSPNQTLYAIDNYGAHVLGPDLGCLVKKI